jgi:3-oxoadipate enol-lactonase
VSGDRGWGTQRTVRLPDHETVVSTCLLGGDGPRKTLVLVHSALLDRRMWRDFVAALGEVHHGSGGAWQVVSHDMRGHGAAAAAPGITGVRQLAQDLVALLDGLGVDTGHVLGLSLGGAVAQEAVLDHPDRIASVVAMCTRPAFPEDVMLDRAALGAGGIADEVEATLQRWFHARSLDRLPDQVGYVRDRLDAVAPGTWRDSWRALAHFDVRDRLGEIRVPLLAVAGEHDEAAPPALVRAIADAAHGTYQRVDGAGHLAPLDSPRSTARAVAPFLFGQPR